MNKLESKTTLGQGSYGLVKLAINQDDKKEYAMKILSKTKLKKKGGLLGRKFLPKNSRGTASQGSGSQGPNDTQNSLQKIYREIAIMKKLDHPNVCKLIEVFDNTEDDNLYLLFELLKGGEILEIPTENPMSEKEAWSAFREIVHGLDYLHYQKIIHRDLKPSNLLRTESGEVKIADFGISNEFDGADAMLTSTAGTPAFKSPEIIAFKAGSDPYSGKAADIWALGITLYSLVYGQVPFHDDNIISLYDKICSQDLVFPEEPSTSPELKDIITKMLIKESVDRIKLIDIKNHEWLTQYGQFSTDLCYRFVEVSEAEIKSSVKTMPKLNTLLTVKSMIQNRSFSMATGKRKSSQSSKEC